VQLKDGRYLWLGDYDRQVASTINVSLKGDGRLYGVYLKSESYFEGVGVNEIWQAFVETRCVLECKSLPLILSIPARFQSTQCIILHCTMHNFTHSAYNQKPLKRSFRC
jgi:hypothetical protein